MPWSSGCNLDVVFDGRYWTLMFEYSLVICDRALSKEGECDVFAWPVSHSTYLANVQTQKLSSSHCSCDNNQLLSH